MRGVRRTASRTVFACVTTVLAACAKFGLEATADAGPDAAPTRADAGLATNTTVPCDAGVGAFCDVCDPALVLCVQFDGGMLDQSSYHHLIELDGGGTPAYVDGGGLALDGSFQMTFASGPKLEANEQLSVEVWAKMRALPPFAARYGLFDRDGIAGMFIYGGDGGAGQPHLRCAGNDVVVPFETDQYMHFACTANATNQRVRIYVDGTPVVEGDAGVSVPPDGGWARHLVLFGNDPSGDDFQGEVASVRMYTRIISADEVAHAANQVPP